VHGAQHRRRDHLIPRPSAFGRVHRILVIHQVPKIRDGRIQRCQRPHLVRSGPAVAGRIFYAQLRVAQIRVRGSTESGFRLQLIVDPGGESLRLEFLERIGGCAKCRPAQGIKRKRAINLHHDTQA
jgi:hypothetical protein